jgi:hypothetical protein
VQMLRTAESKAVDPLGGASREADGLDAPEPGERSKKVRLFGHGASVTLSVEEYSRGIPTGNPATTNVRRGHSVTARERRLSAK